MAVQFTQKAQKTAGRLYLKKIVGGLENHVYVGNSTAISVTQNVTKDTLLNSDKCTGGNIAADYTIDSVELSFTLTTFNAYNIARATGGDVVAIAEASVSGENHDHARQNQLLAFTHRVKTTETITLAENCVDWTAATTYTSTQVTEGVFVVPTTPNTHTYKVTAITTGITSGVEPTWPTDGSDVVDGGVTWTDQGVFAAVSGTDFDPMISGVTITTGGGIPDGCPLTVAYTKLAGSMVTALTANFPKYDIIFESLNKSDGCAEAPWRLYNVQMGPAAEIALKSDGYGELQLTGEVLTNASDEYYDGFLPA